MTLQQLHYFVVTANMRSFTRAAEACMVSQPALSHAIRELEQELGCDLFERCGRCVILTEEGQLCLDKAMEVERQITAMKHIANGKERREITIGYVELGHLNAYMTFQMDCIPQEFIRRHQVFTAYDEITEIRQHLIDRKFDFIIIPAGNCNALPPHRKVQFTEDALNLIVSRENPLFDRDEVDISELKDASFIFYPNNQELNERYRALCRENGFEPRVVGYGKKMGDILTEVLQKNAVAFCSATFGYLENRQIHIIGLKGNIRGFHLELVKLDANKRKPAEELFRMFEAHDLRKQAAL